MLTDDCDDDETVVCCGVLWFSLLFGLGCPLGHFEVERISLLEAILLTIQLKAVITPPFYYRYSATLVVETTVLPTIVECIVDKLKSLSHPLW